MIAAKTTSNSNSEMVSDRNAALLKQIQIKQSQLQIAQEGDMPFVAEMIQRQLEELKAGRDIGELKIHKDDLENKKPVGNSENNSQKLNQVNHENPNQTEQQENNPTAPRMNDFDALMSLLDN